MNAYPITEFAYSCAKAEFFDEPEPDRKESHLQDVLYQSDEMREKFLGVTRTLFFILEQTNKVEADLDPHTVLMLREHMLTQFTETIEFLLELAENFNELKSDAERKLSELQSKAA